MGSLRNQMFMRVIPSYMSLTPFWQRRKPTPRAATSQTGALSSQGNFTLCGLEFYSSSLCSHMAYTAPASRVTHAFLCKAASGVLIRN